MKFFPCIFSALALALSVTSVAAAEGLRALQAPATSSIVALLQGTDGLSKQTGGSSATGDAICDNFARAELLNIPGFSEMVENFAENGRLQAVLYFTCVNAGKIATAYNNAAAASPERCAPLLAPLEAEARELTGADCSVLKPDEPAGLAVGTIIIIVAVVMIIVGGGIFVMSRKNASANANTQSFPAAGVTAVPASNPQFIDNKL